MAMIPETGTLGRWKPPAPSEQRALDAQPYYYPGMQRPLSPDEQERQRAYALIPLGRIE